MTVHFMLKNLHGGCGDFYSVDRSVRLDLDFLHVGCHGFPVNCLMNSNGCGIKNPFCRRNCR